MNKEKIISIYIIEKIINKLDEIQIWQENLTEFDEIKNIKFGSHESLLKECLTEMANDTRNCIDSIYELKELLEKE